MTRYQNDPREIKVKFAGACKKCGCRLPKGVNAFYFPNGKDLFCLPCGETSFRSFLESAADEEFYEQQYRY